MFVIGDVWRRWEFTAAYGMSLKGKRYIWGGRLASLAFRADQMPSSVTSPFILRNYRQTSSGHMLEQILRTPASIFLCADVRISNSNTARSMRVDEGRKG